MPPAPARLSITAGSPHFSANGLATKRAAVSTGPPAGNGTTKLTARSGQSSAACVTGAQPKALTPKVNAAATPNQRRRLLLNVMLVLHRFLIQINQTKLSQYIFSTLTQQTRRLPQLYRLIALDRKSVV